jgi:hypothetical protein
MLVLSLFITPKAIANQTLCQLPLSKTHFIFHPYLFLHYQIILDHFTIASISTHGSGIIFIYYIQYIYIDTKQLKYHPRKINRLFTFIFFIIHTTLLPNKHWYDSRHLQRSTPSHRTIHHTYLFRFYHHSSSIQYHTK